MKKLLQQNFSFSKIIAINFANVKKKCCLDQDKKFKNGGKAK